MSDQPRVPFERSDDFFTWALEMLRSAGQLTKAEVRVCEQLMLGRRYEDIAAMQAISVETVRWHSKRILKKLDIESTREFILAIGRILDDCPAES